MADPDRRLSERSLLTDSERHQLLVEWNKTQMDYHETSIHEQFEAQVERTPEAIAVVLEDQQLTYRQLNCRANQLAHYLRKRGVGPDVLVGICVERSLEMVVGLLAILKAGAAYVPLDPTYPKERLAFMMAETQAPVLLTQRRLVAGLPDLAAKVVCLDVEWDVIAKESVESPSSGVTVDNLAYVVYTSGSTGKPKGVAMSHRPLGNLLWWQLQNSTITDGPRTLQFASLSFDVSFQEIFSTWCSGGTLVLISDELRRDAAALLGFLKDESVERVFLPFVALQQLAGIVHGRGAVPASLREIITSGEQLHVTPHLASLLRNLKDCILYNQYGPSESHVVTAFTFTGSPSNWPALPPIGRPIVNTQVYVLDASLNQAPIGASGELHIGGVGLARGYLNRPDLTAEKFIPHPLSNEPGARLYKTGDLARYRSDGNIEFLGRLDHQVKIRGYRIELGEVEAVLRQHPAVRDAVVVAQGDESGDKWLVAYVILRKETATPANELRIFLTEKLPGHMVPSAFVPLEALPLTPNGKVNRGALLGLHQTRSALSQQAGAYVEPGTATERLLAEIWAEVLGIARIGTNDDFFALGGHSLKATLAIARILDMFGVELTHRCFFEAPTLSALADRIDRFQPRPPKVQPLLMKAVERAQTAPLTWGQTEIWLTSQLQPSVPVYNEPFTIYMHEPVDPVALEEALNEIIRRHEILRTAFTIRGDQPVQVIQDEARLPLSVTDLAMLTESDRAGEALRLVTAEALRSFDLADPPLMRARLVRMNENDCRLYLTVFHMVVDAYSIYNVLIPELWQLYESLRHQKPSPLRILPVQYADYARWQRWRLQGLELEKCLTYWKNQLDGAVPLEVPTDRQRPPVRTFHGAYQSFDLSKELTDALNAWSRREGVTLYMMLLAAFNTLLWRYAQQDEIVVGTAEAGRNRPEFEQLLGYFLNTLVLRCHIADNPKFHHFLQRVREVTLQAYAHRDMPFGKLVEELQPTRDPSRHPLFQVAFVMEPTMLTHESGWTISQFDVQTGTSKFDLTLELEERAEGIIGRFEYNTDLLDGETIGRMIAHLQALLEGIVAAPHRRLSDLPLLTQAEQYQQLVQWNNTKRDYPRDTCIHQLFEAQAERTPEAVAVIFEDQQLTYRELNRRANQLAHFLRKLAVGPEVLVGICMERSPEMIVAVLGILKAGGAYVPLDPEYPKDRLSYMLEDSQAQVLLTQKRLVAELTEDRKSEIEEGDPRIQVVGLDMDWQVIAQESESNPIGSARADNLAYLIYTSGSTGRPKGVLVEHRGLCNLAEAQIQSFDLRPDNRILQFSSLSFDAAIFEIVMALRVGASLCLGTRDSLLPGPTLSRLLRDQAVTNITIPPSSLATLPADKLPLLRTIIAAGEACSADLVARWASGHRFFNAFGPTETTVWATVAECVDGGRKPPIGRPIANTQIYLLDAHLQPVPIGVPGELHIGGVGLARGYLNRPDLSAEKFIPNPFIDESGARLYKTGDLARYLPDGNIEFLGRIDHQVKIRGFRVELGEIETVLAQHPAVRETVVVAREDTSEESRVDDNPKSKIENLKSDKRLVAYVVSNWRPSPTTGEFRNFLRAKLPDYMIPASFVFLESLPLTPNGKVNRKALPAPGPTRPNLDQDFIAPKTAIEQRVADIWAKVLGLGQIGIHDNFFDLGGHSLLATLVLSRIREAFQLEIPLRSIFESPTVAGLAGIIETARTIDQDLRVSTRTPESSGRHYPLSFAQRRLWFLEQLEPGTSIYNIAEAIRVRGPLHVEALVQSLNEIVRRHQALRTVFKDIEGQPVQLILPSLILPLPVVDLSDHPENSRQDEARRLVSEETGRPFDFFGGPLLRATLLRLGRKDHVLLLTMHHIVSDGWSLGVFYRELTAVYNAVAKGLPSPLTALTSQYCDYARWQRQWLEGETLDAQLAYWKEQLAGVPTLQLPTDRPRPAIQSFRGARQWLVLPKETTKALKALSQKQHATLFMTLLAAFQALLYRHSGQCDIAVGVPIAGRNRYEYEGLIGFFVNTLVLRTDLSGHPTFRALLNRVRDVALEAYAHQDLPFEKLVEELQPERDLSRNPLFQVLFQLRNLPKEALRLSDANIERFAFERGIAKFDLTLDVTDADEKLHCSFDYNTDLFEASTITRMQEYFTTLLENVVARPDAVISEIVLLTPAEQHRLLADWNDTEEDYPKDKCIHQLFEEQVERTPDATALVFEDRQLTYRELNAQANQLAHYLRKQGVGSEVPVALCVERSLEMFVGLLGVLKAGGAYVPLDPDYPEERLKFMLEDTHTPVLLTQQRFAARLMEGKRPLVVDGACPSPMLDRRIQVLCLDSDWEIIGRESEQNPAAGKMTNSLAYVIYTSGSTGRSKGVAVEHRQIVNYSSAIIKQLNPVPGSSLAMVQPLMVDACLTVICASLLTGGSLHVISRELSLNASTLAEYFSRRPIDFLKIAPSHLIALQAAASTGQLMPHRCLMIGGEPSRWDWAQSLQALAPDRTIINHYGPTETTVGVLTHRLENANPPHQYMTTPLGRPIANTRVFVLDSSLHPVPIGVAGELYIGGAGVARGYLNRPELTAERFMPDPFSNHPGERLYKSGDLGRYLPDGNIEFLGRTDHQVKIRGYRVEPGEIEAALSEHPGIAECAVVARGDDGNPEYKKQIATGQGESPQSKNQFSKAADKRLVAYVVPARDRAVTIAGRQRYQLPNGMAVAQLNKNETDYMYGEIFERQAYLRHGIAINDGDCIFDVGANIGLFTLFAQQICNSSKVYSFEPNPVVFELLRANALLYGRDVKAFAFGLSNEAKTARFTFFPGFSLFSGFYADPKTEREVVKTFMLNQQGTGVREMAGLIAEADEILEQRFVQQTFPAPLRSLSDIIEEEQIACIDLLKINAEKSDLDVLSGIKDCDWKKIKQIVLEVDIRENLDAILSLLASRGYEFTVEQDALLANTDLRYVYAIRPSSDRKLIREHEDGVHIRPLPVLKDSFLSSSELRSFLRQKLPEPLLPSVFVILEAMPLTPHGKLNRQGLPDPDNFDPEIDGAYVAPRNSVEKTIAQFWCELLSLDAVGIHRNFFDLGGHSLLATQLISRVRATFRIDIPLRALFENPTVAGLGNQIARIQASQGVPDAIASVFADLQSISDDEARDLLNQEKSEES